MEIHTERAHCLRILIWNDKLQHIQLKLLNLKTFLKTKVDLHIKIKLT